MGRQRKQIALDSNKTFADIDSIRKVQEATALAQKAKDVRTTRSEDVIISASEQTGLLRIEDMFEFQV
jgi:hypothetical protein